MVFTPTPQMIRRLSSGRWLMPILAQMSREDGSRFGGLVRALGLSRSVLSGHLVALERFGLIVRNPGHGHPLRPEYLLTDEGVAVAAWCERVMRERTRLGLEPGSLGRWSLPLIGQLHAGWQRFSQLEQMLTPITPRALSLTVQQARGVDLASTDGRLYGLTVRGQALATVILG